MDSWDYISSKLIGEVLEVTVSSEYSEKEAFESEHITPIIETLKFIVEEVEMLMERTEIADGNDSSHNLSSEGMSTVTLIEELTPQAGEKEFIKLVDGTEEEEFLLTMKDASFEDEEYRELGFQFTCCEESEADSTVLEVDDIEPITSTGDGEVPKEKLDYEIGKIQQDEEGILHKQQNSSSTSVGSSMDQNPMKSVETSITPGRFKPQMIEQETFMDIQMVDSESSTIDFDKLVEGLVLESYPQLFAGTGEITDEIEKEKYTQNPKTDKTTTKRKHSVNFTRRDPRFYEEDCYDGSDSTPPDSFVSSKKAKENTTPSFSKPSIRVGLSRLARPRQPLHENVVIKTYPDPIEKDQDESSEEEEDE